MLDRAFFRYIDFGIEMLLSRLNCRALLAIILNLLMKRFHAPMVPGPVVPCINKISIQNR